MEKYMQELWQKTPKSEPLNQVEKELGSFYEYCEASGFTKEEMDEICKPLTSILTKSKLRDYAINVLILATLFGLIYLFTDTISWNICAVGRLIMVRLLPFLNWEKFSNEKCLLPNYFLTSSPTSGPRHFDCNLCEGIEAIPREVDVDPDKLSELYLDVNVPVIVKDGLRNYPSNKFEFNLTEAILFDPKLRSSYPCDVASNILDTSADVATILLKSYTFKKWFFHFQNCAISAVKQFRVYAPRPYFLRPEILPVQYSWLLMSAYYKAGKYKKIELLEKIAVFGQIEGSNFVRLTPRLNCIEECPTLEVELRKNEAIVFNSLWDLTYKPNHSTQNIAVILETH